VTHIVLGPPGTGKTKTLLDAVEAELAAGTPPDRIGFVTFTRRAAEEAVARASSRFRLERRQLPHFRTLHSMCFRQLGLTPGDVLDTQRLQREFSPYAGVELTGRWGEDGAFHGYAEGDRLLFMENLARVRGVPLRSLHNTHHDGLRWRQVEHVSRALSQFKSERGVMDYTDMLEEFVRRDAPPPLVSLYVDEAQDLSQLQWAVVRCLARGVGQLTVAGDDDQSIYRWAGADVEELVRMPGDVRVLGQSYRCPARVQELATSVLSGVRGPRRAKDWRARRGAVGEVVHVGDVEQVDLGGAWESDGVQPVLVLARNEYVLREQVEPELRQRGVIYEHAGKTSVRQSTLDAVEAWEELRAGRAVSVEAALRAYAQMTAGQGVEAGHKDLPGFPRGDGAPPVTMAQLLERGGLRTSAIWHEALDRLPRAEVSYLLRARRHGERLRSRPRVRVSTIHGAKGGEARHVVLMTEMARRTYREMEVSPDDERRVWYVAVTRARERLSVVGLPSRRRAAGAGQVPWL
jgi:DNA helicase-2/ATP-dependent DNA helicase PcrA